ncbi:Cytochrome P450, E-class, group I [Parasponia andersonii]|uniref:Cytochrome P450, E-class, group I n=1 Tax=Parasponia andersonii TaxID=3476 RepID=A0A2P5BLM4_PARAD|nr:Cytochrome P450, E-class, group I [Parasponia andersonii]
MELLSLQSFLILLPISIYLFYYYYHSEPKRPQISRQTGFKNYPIVGVLPEFLKNRHKFLQWSTQVLGSCPTNTAIFFRPYKFYGVMTANPINVEHMLKTNFENYPKGDRFISMLGDFLGRGIFNSDGDLWKLQRKTASHEFNTKSLRNFVVQNVIVEIKTRLVPLLEQASKSGWVLDLQEVLERFAFDNVCKLAFNFDPGCLGGHGDGAAAGAEFMAAFEEAATVSCGRFFYAFPSLWKTKKFFNIGSERSLRKSISAVHRFADNIIQSRLKAKVDESQEDLLFRFIGNNENSPEFLRDIIISFILAGRDTTSSALTWFFWLLSSRPDVREKILKELEAIRVRTGKTIGDTYGVDELRDMDYLQAAISESMRLYPPVPVDTKESLNDDVFPDGTFVGKNWLVMYQAYAMGRMKSIWGNDCEEFRPERWLENGAFRQENPFRFPVFHAGPRMCLGKDMATIQMKSIAASVIERFDIDVRDKLTCPDYVMALTLRMKGGLPVTVRVRERSGGVHN